MLQSVLFCVFVATLVISAPNGGEPSPSNWCRVGAMVMIPDGREGPVTSVDGDICRVLAYGERYVSLWPYTMIEPVPIQTPVPPQRNF